MKWLENLKKDWQLARSELKLLSEQGRTSRANKYPVPPEELKEFNTGNIPAVTTFIRDIAAARRAPTMTQLVSFLAGEEGKVLDDHIRETFEPDWRSKAWQNLDREHMQDILQTLSAFAKARGHNPDDVAREYEIRHGFVAKAQEAEGKQR
jgi:hypothetical protein